MPVTALQLDFLEKEINSRHMYWLCRRKKEEWLLKELNSLILHVLDAAREGKTQKVRCILFAAGFWKVLLKIHKELLFTHIRFQYH